MSQHPKPKMTIAAEVRKLERERPVLNAAVDYTIEGEVETRVHSTLMAEREGAITRGWKRLQGASIALEHDLPKAALSGLARANFDAKADGAPNYIRQQKSAAMKRLELEHARKITPQRSR